MHDRFMKGLARFLFYTRSGCAEKLCNKVAMIDHGKIVAYGDMKEILGSGLSLEEMFLEKIDSTKRGNGAE